MPQLQGGTQGRPKRLSQPASGVRQAASARAHFNRATNALNAPYVVRQLDAAAEEVTEALAQAREAEDKAEASELRAAWCESQEEAAARTFVERKYLQIETWLAAAEADCEREISAEKAQVVVDIREVKEAAKANEEQVEAAIFRENAELQSAIARENEEHAKETEGLRAIIAETEQRERVLEYKLSVKNELVEEAARTHRSLESRIEVLEEGLTRKAAQLVSLHQRSGEVERLEDENVMLKAALEKQLARRSGSARSDQLEAENQSLRAALLERADENDWLRMMWDAGR